MSGWWRIEVRDGDGVIVAIEPEMLAGRPLDDAAEGTVRTALAHLSGFIGQADQPAEAPRHTCNTQESLNGPCLACIADEQRAAFPTSGQHQHNDPRADEQ